MKVIRPLAVVVVLILVGLSAHAQRKPVLDDEFNGAAFDDFVKKLEEQSGYHFYYNSAWTDSIKVTLSAKNRSVEDVLKTVFENTNLKFAVTSDGAVFITREREIMTRLPDDFFIKDARPRETASFDFSEYERREKSKRQAE